jgi:translocation and assembly module TamB
MDVDEAHVLANPDLEVVYDGSLVRVAGLVVVPEADIDYQRDRERGPVEPSRDVVFVGAERPAVGEPVLQIAARVRVVLGDEVKLAALGLETELEGSLLIVEQPGVATSASGELRLQSGTFQAYGQDLVIDRGRLFFAGGPLTDPGIDLRAHRSVPEADVTAGIQATGTLRAPVVTLWSEPAMGESQVLSYLLLGRPLEATRAEEGSLLANAATALGVSGGNLLAEKLAARYGLEEASIQTGDTFEEAAFVVGKYLSPRLYVSYGIGLFNAVNTLRIRYLVSERVHLQAETGATTSGDVLYTFERGSPDPQEIGEHLYRDLPRVSADELATPPKVPVGSGGQQAPEEEPTEPVIAPEQESEPDGR